ncbi:MAG: hypothetical protein COV52_00165 [Gammaproteobacteria bacterium CG11_big_fil_rev_8_21_14_0_20_46_22]|nr:MAG: hypothetical protein COW05_03535 [Gammaproteobacteria bacterium CG12_big_fil_rev_8_21_14_0_65_46_12]PIR12177.1 MAG: hypothetical protein COV52_00165 [Gammaproteobacteria bacterium CG11_big_fil_rev_8_21_14_0_20_46_22]
MKIEQIPNTLAEAVEKHKLNPTALLSSLNELTHAVQEHKTSTLSFILAGQAPAQNHQLDAADFSLFALRETDILKFEDKKVYFLYPESIAGRNHQNETQYTTENLQQRLSTLKSQFKEKSTPSSSSTFYIPLSDKQHWTNLAIELEHQSNGQVVVKSATLYDPLKQVTPNHKQAVEAALGDGVELNCQTLQKQTDASSCGYWVLLHIQSGLDQRKSPQTIKSLADAYNNKSTNGQQARTAVDGVIQALADEGCVKQAAAIAQKSNDMLSTLEDYEKAIRTEEEERHKQARAKAATTAQAPAAAAAATEVKTPPTPRAEDSASSRTATPPSSPRSVSSAEPFSEKSEASTSSERSTNSRASSVFENRLTRDEEFEEIDKLFSSYSSTPRRGEYDEPLSKKPRTALYAQDEFGQRVESRIDTLLGLPARPEKTEAAKTTDTQSSQTLNNTHTLIQTSGDKKLIKDFDNALMDRYVKLRNVRLEFDEVMFRKAQIQTLKEFNEKLKKDETARQYIEEPNAETNSAAPEAETPPKATSTVLNEQASRFFNNAVNTLLHPVATMQKKVGSRFAKGLTVAPSGQTKAPRARTQRKVSPNPLLAIGRGIAKLWSRRPGKPKPPPKNPLDPYREKIVRPNPRPATQPQAQTQQHTGRARRLFRWVATRLGLKKSASSMPTEKDTAQAATAAADSDDAHLQAASSALNSASAAVTPTPIISGEPTAAQALSATSTTAAVTRAQQSAAVIPDNNESAAAADEVPGLNHQLLAPFLAVLGQGDNEAPLENTSLYAMFITYMSWMIRKNTPSASTPTDSTQNAIANAETAANEARETATKARTVADEVAASPEFAEARALQAQELAQVRAAAATVEQRLQAKPQQQRPASKYHAADKIQVKIVLKRLEKNNIDYLDQFIDALNEKPKSHQINTKTLDELIAQHVPEHDQRHIREICLKGTADAPLESPSTPPAP